MSQYSKTKKTLLLSFILLLIFSLPVMAKPTDWKNPMYNFDQVRTILVKNPVFSYEYPEYGTNTGKNYFEKYPHSENVIRSILAKQTGKLPKYNFIYEPVEHTAPAPLHPASESKNFAPPQGNSRPASNMDGVSGLVLSVKIIDFGWYYVHHEGYWTTKSIPKEETIYEKDSSGKMREVGKKKSTTIVPFYEPPGYKIKDYAGAEFVLADAKTGQAVWTHTDYRDRESNKNSWEKDGPESMMNRIFATAFEKMPLVKK